MKVLVEIESVALGDNVGAVAVISKYQEVNNYDVTVISNHPDIFVNSYPNLKFIKKGDTVSDFYNEKIATLYKFDVPLLEGYAKYFGITTEGITLKVDSVEGQRPIKKQIIIYSIRELSPD